MKATPSLKGKSILIAEDDYSSYIYLRQLLKKKGANVIIVTDGESAVEMVKNHNSISLVLMDIKLPGINGYEATRKIREFNKEIPIIAETAYAMIGERERALDAGCNDYIAKPIKTDEIMKLILEHLKE